MPFRHIYTQLRQCRFVSDQAVRNRIKLTESLLVSKRKQPSKRIRSKPGIAFFESNVDVKSNDDRGTEVSDSSSKQQEPSSQSHAQGQDKEGDRLIDAPETGPEK